MMTYLVVTLIWLCILHFVADFMLQSRTMAKNKSKLGKHMLYHLLIYFVVFAIFAPLPMIILVQESRNMLIDTYISSIVCALKITFWHLIIDGALWNVYKIWYMHAALTYLKRFPTKLERWYAVQNTSIMKYWEHKSFYDMIGFDQLLHITVILIVYIQF